jgi:hypothetical protein
MIQDAVPWREELLKIAGRLERRKTQRRWTERTGFLVERDVMLSAYALRKLLEAQKISDSLAAHKVTVKQYVLKSGAAVPDMLSRYEVWENYELENARRVEFAFRELCNQIVHSWNWMISATEDLVFDGFFVSSDRERAKSIHFVSIDAFIELLRAVGSEDIIGVVYQRDSEGQMRKIKVYNGNERALMEADGMILEHGEDLT